MESAGVAQLKARLSEYLSRVKAGEEVLVRDRGKPVARLVPVGAWYVPDNEAEHARLRAMEREGLVRLGDLAPRQGRLAWCRRSSVGARAARRRVEELDAGTAYGPAAWPRRTGLTPTRCEPPAPCSWRPP